MKDIILKFLMENTELMHKYTGGGEDPIVIVLSYSELGTWSEEEKQATLTVTAERLAQALRDEGARID
jgi:hypothetical protein